MKRINDTIRKGFTLIEMLLVLVIVSIFLYVGLGYIQQRTLAMRIDRASQQMQQILNAALAYYVANGSWPANLSALQGVYLPPASVPLKSPWGQNYTLLPATTTPPAQVYVYTPIIAATGSTTGSASAAANVIAGKLPLAYTTAAAPAGVNPPAAGTACTNSTTTCYVVASVNIPGQNLNNASALNFAGVYKNGGCVPVPTCPVDAQGNTMTPQIVVAVSSVSGNADTSQFNVYPIYSFTAYATGPSSAPPPCQGATLAGGSNTACYSDVTGGTLLPAGNYWRVCVAVTTSKGPLGWGDDTTNAFKSGFYEQVVAMTRCSINNEPSGSSFNVYTP